MRPYFNCHQGVYSGNQPCFYRKEDVDGVSTLEQGSEVIFKELVENLLDSKKRKACFQKFSLGGQEGWRQIELEIYGVEYSQRTKLFPKTMEILSRIDGLATAYFSHLSPKTRIPAHAGECDAYYRVHLGLKIPAMLPGCGIEVAGQRKSWQEGKCIVFNDIYFHTAWNDTDEERIVLIVDILRPEFRDEKIWVDSGVRATLYYARLYGIFWPVVELLPRVVTRLGRPLFHAIAYAWHLARNRLKTDD